jgi:tRNA (guanine-N7-)-methyltransferase
MVNGKWKEPRTCHAPRFAICDSRFARRSPSPEGRREQAMFANSRAIESSQISPHPRLLELVRKHLDIPFRREPSAAGRAAVAAIAQRLHEPFILDAGCGTGASTLALARMFPGQLVLGVDKSAVRLAIGQRELARDGAPSNALLLHCELVDFWQLAAEAGLRCERQFLLYPNPWPKPEHLQRRWHGHSVFPALLALGGTLELCTNWRVYAEEFAAALRIAGHEAVCEAFVPDHALTPFERKYLASGHALWRVAVTSTARKGDGAT